VSPNIDDLAEDGFVFERAIAQSTFTGCSVASLFTGLNPHHHGLFWGSLTEDDSVATHVVSPNLHTMAEELADRGYRTAGWFQNRMLRKELGFGQGFEIYDEIRGDKNAGSRRIVDSYLDWIGNRSDDAPSFAYLHVLDLHDPYDPNPPFDTMFLSSEAVAPGYDRSDSSGWHAWVRQVNRGRRQVSKAELEWIKARYDGVISSVDRQVGRLVSGLKALGRYENTIIVLTADHGDGFNEHGFLSHSNLPYFELVHVPLILKPAGPATTVGTVPFQVRLIDLLPTLVEMAEGGDVDLPQRYDGCSLQLLMTAAAEDPRPEHCREALSEVLVEGQNLTVAVREGDLSYLEGEGFPPALFDRGSDPQELKNLAGTGHPSEPRFHRRVLEVLVSARAVDVGHLSIDPETVEQIRALGYVE